MEQQQQQNSRTPTDFLNSVIGREVLVKLNSGIDYKGMRYSTDDECVHDQSLICYLQVFSRVWMVIWT